MHYSLKGICVLVMVLNATFNNISIISSVLLVGGTGVHGENHRLVASQ